MKPLFAFLAITLALAAFSHYLDRDFLAAGFLAGYTVLLVAALMFVPKPRLALPIATTQTPKASPHVQKT